ncbi:calpain-3-like isoform X1 [Lates japonicus]|uniref:Calpain-3-like isoform X1 n=1 Tax=Lates japonicus TaxID=270547 RepID=A0AAD3NDR2_LATJO|nr:calpain-3-like isoform X1 [Lates japonicus]
MHRVEAHFERIVLHRLHSRHHSAHQHDQSELILDCVSFPHQAALPSLEAIRQLFRKHSNKKMLCKPVHLHSLLTEAIQGGVLAGSEKNLALEHCKSLVVLMDVSFKNNNNKLVSYLNKHTQCQHCHFHTKH